MTRTWDELWEGIEWDRVTTIPFITERIHEIKAMGDRLKEKAERYDGEHKAAMIVEEELRKIDDKLEAVKEYIEHPFFVFFKEMVKVYNYHAPTKGESWKTSSWAYLMDRLTNQLEDMQNDPDRENYMANIGNYAAMIRLNEILEAET